MTTRFHFPAVLRRLARSVRGAHGWWRRFLALTRLGLGAVCAESETLDEYDHHSRTDDADGATDDTVGRGRCRRCGKWFRL